MNSHFIPLQKCKAAGMKTSWVLTEDDKSKVGRRPLSGEQELPSYSGAGDIIIKTEHEDDSPNMDPDGEGRVKQRRASSPMTSPFRQSSQPYSAGDNLYSGQLYFPTCIVIRHKKISDRLVAHTRYNWLIS